ncbi:MAG TPA: hypothetical protein V6C86_25715 [Oculatellaceae cyanobacterium]
MTKVLSRTILVIAIIEAAVIAWLVYTVIDQSITVSYHEDHIQLLGSFAEKHGKILLALLKGKSRTDVKKLLNSISSPDLIVKSDGPSLIVEDLEFKFRDDVLFDICSKSDDFKPSKNRR